MSSQGIGRGLAEGVQTAGQYVMQGMQMRQRNQLAQHSMDADMAWRRAYAGLPPAYEEADQAAQAAAGDTLPQSRGLEQITFHGSRLHGGRLDFPLTQFRPEIQEAKQPVRPLTSETIQKPGAMALIPPMRPGAMSRLRRKF